MTAQRAIARRIGIGLVTVCVAVLSSSCAAGQMAHTSREVPVIDGTTGAIGSMELHAVAIRTPSGSSYAEGADAELTLIIVNNGKDDETLTRVSSPRFRSSGTYKNADDAGARVKADTSAAAASPSNSSSIAGGSPSDSSSSGGASASASPSGSSPSGSGSSPATGATQPPGSLGSLSIKSGLSLAIGLSGTGTDTSGQPVILLEGLRKGPLFPGESIPITFTFGNAGAVTLTVPVQLSVAPNNSRIPSGTTTG